MKVYLIDEDAYRTLQRLSDYLNNGNDPMRYAGHSLWLLLQDCIQGPVDISEVEERSE